MSLARRILWTLTVTYWVALFTLTHVPPAHLPQGPGGDKAMHFLAYFALAFLVGSTFYLAFPARVRLMPLAVIVLAAGYGAFDELTQPLVGRFAEWGDWYADCAGAAAAAAVLFVLQRLFPPRASGNVSVNVNG